VFTSQAENCAVGLVTGSGQAVMAGQRLAGGGQGEIFAVVSHQELVFKRYLPRTLAQDQSLERRLSVMTGRPVQWREPGSGHLTLAWPTDLVRDDGRFAGFLMPAVDMDRTVGLHRITNPTDRAAATGPTSWTRDFTWRYLVRTAANLAQATAVLHQAGVVIGDFNDSNIRAWREARVTLLDCDSMQIRDPGSGERFFCHVGRPEFTPPELAGADWARTVRHPSSDLFALAIHLYQLLLEGEHPFRGRWNGPGEKPAVSELASQGIWAHRGSGLLEPRRAAIGARLLPGEILGLFRRTFEDGATDPLARPTAAAWYRALDALADQLRTCADHPAHVYPASHLHCPWCEYVPPPAPPPLPAPPLPAPPLPAPPPPAPPPPARTRRHGRAGTATAAGQLPSRGATTIPGQPAPGGPPTPATAGRQFRGWIVVASVLAVIGIIIGIHEATSGSSGPSLPVVVGPSPTHTLQTQAYEVTSVAFSPDGTTLAAGDLLDSAVVWNAATGRGVATFADPGTYPDNKIPRVSAVAFSPSGTTLATANHIGTVYLWDVATRRSTEVLTDPRDAVTSPVATPNPNPVALNAVAFSPDGALVAAGDADGHTYLWDVATGHLAATFTDPKKSGESVDAVAFSPGGTTMATADADGSTYLWDVATGSLIATLSNDEAANAVAFSADGTVLATAENFADIELWNAATGRPIAILADPNATGSDPDPNVTGVAFSATGMMATCDSLGYTSLWDVRTRRVVRTFTDTQPGLEGTAAVALNPSGTILATGDSDGTVYVWNLAPKSSHTPARAPATGL
jgi:WD40 repeat protein